MVLKSAFYSKGSMSGYLKEKEEVEVIKTYIITPEVGLDYAQNVLGDRSEVIFVPSSTEEEIIKNAKDADVLINIYEPITKKVMDALPNLKFISVASIGFDTVDIAYAKEKGIMVSNNPNYCIEEVADHTVALMLTLSRKVLDYNRHVKEEKKWVYDAFGNVLHRLGTRSVGFVGYGAIARKVAKRMRAFGAKILAYDPFLTEDMLKNEDVELVSIEELLERSHILSIHMPLKKDTKGFFDKERFQFVKNSPILINCARGEIIDEDALLWALDQGIISAAGLDVLSSENPNLDNHPFVERDNVILTPHMAFYSQESMDEAQTLAAKHVLYYLDGELEKIPLIVRNEK